jgi:hypothetical protein
MGQLYTPGKQEIVAQGIDVADISDLSCKQSMVSPTVRLIGEAFETIRGLDS